MHELCIPAEVWGCVARYYENPILLLKLAEVCRNSYNGATMDSAWESLIPYECEGNLYRAFIEAALSTTDENRCIIRSCWTGSFPPKDCFPEIAFERRDFDTAFALAAQKEHLGSWPYEYLVSFKERHRYMRPKKYSYLFDECVRSRKFMFTALKFSPWLYDNYYNPQIDIHTYRCQFVRSNAEYCEVAMQLSVEAWNDAKLQRFPVWKNFDLRKKILTLCPRAFTDIYSHSNPCTDPELILAAAPSYRSTPTRLVFACHPEVFGLELCEELCRIGFPIWVAQPNIGASFLRKFECYTELPPQFENDREIFASVAKNNCEILRDAVPEFRRDISLIMEIFEHNPGVLRYCDASIFTDAKFLRCFKEALSKPNYFFSRTSPDRYHLGRRFFPEVLQTRELALIAVESCGQWIHYFHGFWCDFEVMKAAVVTWPRAHGYTWHYLKKFKNNWDEHLCKIDPRAIWFAGKQFIRDNRSIVHKALQLEPALSDFDCRPFWPPPHGFAKHIECVLPDVLRAHPSNYGTLCLEEKNRRFILRRKPLIIAALEGTRDSSILWDVPLEILDGDIWNKAREVR